jgi:hypothetical protein
MEHFNTKSMKASPKLYSFISIEAPKIETILLTWFPDGMFHNISPIVTTDPNKLEEQARGVLKLESYNYVAGGAGERATMDANRLAFRQWKLVPRMLRAPERNLTVELFGEVYSKPISVCV